MIRCFTQNQRQFFTRLRGFCVLKREKRLPIIVLKQRRFSMRVGFIALLALCLSFSLHAYAQSNGVNFGNLNCEGSVPCAPTPDNLAVIAQTANICVGRHFAISNEPFSSTSFPDSNGCLQLSNTPTTSSGSTHLTFTPSCCVVNNGDSCYLHCQLTGTH